MKAGCEHVIGELGLGPPARSRSHPPPQFVVGENPLDRVSGLFGRVGVVDDEPRLAVGHGFVGAAATACDLGHAAACFELARLVRFGKGGDKDPELERDLLRRACEAGHARGVVVCGADADRFAADEFVGVVERITGGALPIVGSADADGPRVLIGAAAETAFTPEEIADLSYDGYRIRARGDVLAIVGRTARGTMNGVCGFLQDNWEPVGSCLPSCSRFCRRFVP